MSNSNKSGANPNFDALGDRMKRYENISRIKLPRRIPVIIRVDGKAFHTFTRGLARPFDSILMNSVQRTMQKLCENIQGAKFAYCQSDEISILLTDYATITTDAWFDYNVQKMTSISASMATSYFNKFFAEEIHKAIESSTDPEAKAHLEAMAERNVGNALFDSRAFSIPFDEVCNCFIWRQKDARRNSIEMVGRYHLGHSALMNKTCNMIQDMLFTQKGINWNDLPVDCKRGVSCYRVPREEDMPDPRHPGQTVHVTRKSWIIDHDTPEFSKSRDFVEQWLEPMYRIHETGDVT